MSVGEIYALAGIEAPSGEDGSFQAVVDRATTALAAQTELPAFEDWAAAYARSPDAYDADMIGFWKDQA